eukprot:CAMPEP_0172645502 /NCGR_PEP_ID=MMETSP1068-20121228/239760_1 /TAXON_ID=35684 /ORGANISM="Pseudopedinella elastica, Strain CCMP716" /LENGTH=566 /DNA_ID=CAMNT_0013459739 /DNA_START=415 /DNA_END=2115 /DNA_ORIENTATION=-
MQHVFLAGYVSFDLPKNNDWPDRVVVRKVHADDFKISKERTSAHLMNFIRFYMPELLPDADKVMWLDADVIVTGDIHALLESLFNGKYGEAAIAAVQRSKKVLPATRIKPEQLSTMGLNRDPQEWAKTTVFNAGICVLNLQVWRREGYTAEVERVVLELRARGLGSYQGMNTPESSQTPLVLLFSGVKGRFQPLDSCWNMDGLGWKKRKRTEIETSCALHWSGPAKPWFKVMHPKSMGNGLWTPYDEAAQRAGLGTIRSTEKHTRNKKSCTTAHIALALDEKGMAGLPALLYSIYNNTAKPECVQTHVFLAGDIFFEPPKNSHWPDRVVVRKVHAEDFKISKERTTAHLTNFIRFYMPELLPDVDKVMWLDADVIVTGDIHALLESLFNGHYQKAALAAVPRKGKMLLSSTRLKIEQLSTMGLNRDPQEWAKTTVFNAGICVLNLQVWRREGYTAEVERVVLELRARGLGSYQGMNTPESSQTPLVLLFSGVKGRFQPLDSCWNMDGLGWKKRKRTEIETSCALHWSGPAKPWHAVMHKASMGKDMWTPYDEAAQLTGLSGGRLSK